MATMDHASETGTEFDDRPAHLVWQDVERQDPLHALVAPTPEPQAPNLRPTAFLDGLRGLAAFLVYMCHHIPWYYGIPGPLDYGFGYNGMYYLGQLPFIRSAFTGGNAAVAIFFVLSGYVLSTSPLKMLRNGKHSETYQHLIAATIRRPFRLFIPPAGVSFIFALIMQLPYPFTPTLLWPPIQDNLFLELANWFKEFCIMINPFEKHGVFEHWFPYDPPAWTMAMEFKGSVVVFSLIALFSPLTPKQRILAFASCGLVLFVYFQWSLTCFMCGVVLAINDIEGFDLVLFRKVSARTKNIIHNTMFVTAWYLLCQPAGKREVERSYNTWGWYYLTQLIPSTYYNDEYWRFFNVIGAFMFVYSVLRLSWLQRFFTRPTLQYLGRVSFSLYLVHIPFEWTVGDRLYRLIGIKRQEFTTMWDDWIWIPDIGPEGLSTGFFIMQAIILPINLMMAEYGTKYLDEPGVKVGKWMVGRMGLGSKKPPASGTTSSSKSPKLANGKEMLEK